MRSLALFTIAIASASLSAAQSRIEAEQERERVTNYREYAAGISALTSRLEAFIAEELVRKAGASEFPPARRYAMHDLDGDKKDDLFLVTTFEPLSGGNHHESHLFAVLTSRPSEVQHLVVGGRGWRDADRFQASERVLFLQFKVWAKSDSQCCPSLASTAEVHQEKGRLVLKSFDDIKREAPGW